MRRRLEAIISGLPAHLRPPRPAEELPSAYELEGEILRALRSAGRSEVAREFELLVKEDLRELLDCSRMELPGRASSVI